ncbi:MAG: aminomethyl-transferring glycine dehydrogenase subunit GcvPB [bacterium]|nr:aminomethyl-transferring glycine dehydrogenase subunit GcvPB [bacterium]
MKNGLRKYHAAVWDEPLVMEMGATGRRGQLFPVDEPGFGVAVDEVTDLIPEGMRRERPAELPELSEPDVLRHYLHLSQEVLGMMGISLFGTCTMKYNPRVTEALTRQPFVAETHPDQDVETLQGTLEIIHGLDRMLRELTGMDQFVFQPGGGADAAFLHATVTRAYHEARGDLAQRREIITTVQAHPCNPATAAAAGFEVINLPLEEEGYASVEALRSVASERTAALMVNNPDDIGIYNPHIKEWVDIVHSVGGLCFYDHANYNGVMGRIRARELGFDACMMMLHKTFGAPKAGGGPAVGAYGCSEDLAPYLTTPVVTKGEDGRYSVKVSEQAGSTQVREYLGNIPVVIKAYAWLRALGAAGVKEAADLSLLANNYMETRLLQIPGVTKGLPHLDKHRMEMTRYSLGELTEETGVTTLDVQNRMVDYGVDAFWLSHEPWFIPEPFTPEAGEMWSVEDLDYWVDVIAAICEEARTDPELVKTAPHNQPIHRVAGTGLDDPERWATTWRAYRRKNGLES